VDSFERIPSESWPDANMPPPRIFQCLHPPRFRCAIHRLSISIPEEVIVHSVERDKAFDFSPLVPNYFPFSAKSQYGLGRHDEPVAREMIARSYFAWTHRRGCWTAQRHLEILASGSVPLFVDLDRCPDLDQCLPGYPARLVARAARLPGVSWMLTRSNGTHGERGARDVFIDPTPVKYYHHVVHNILRPGIIDHRIFNRTAYFELADELLAYTKRHLTTKAMAAHFLRVMGAQNARVVFATTSFWLPDSVGLIHGLVALGLDVVVNSQWGMRKAPWAATEEEVARSRTAYFFPGFRAAGYMFGMRTNRHKLRECTTDVDCLALVKNGTFDVYAYIVMGDGIKPPFFDEYVRDNVDPAKVAFIDGEDQASTFVVQKDFSGFCERGYKLFTREMFEEDADVRTATV